MASPLDDRYRCAMRSRAVLPIAVIALLAACTSPGAATPAPSEAPAASAAPSAAPTAETDGGPPVAGTDLNACELVTPGDIAAALGIEPAEVLEGRLTETPNALSPGHTDCRYDGDWGGLSVSLTPDDGENLYDAARGAYDDASDREVAGADGAFWSESTTRGFFWKGSVAVLLQFSHITADADWDAATTAIGQAAMDRVN
jgi:hypothetical protein